MATVPGAEGDRHMLTVGIHGIPDNSGRGHAHDHAIALIRNGAIVSDLLVERFSRDKHDGNLSVFFDELLRPHIHQNEEIRFVLVNSFYGKSFTSSTGSLSMTALENSRPEHIIAPCPIKTTGYLQNHKTSGWVVSHELAHIASCLPFCGAFLDDSLLVHIDGGASVSANSVWRYKDGKLDCLSYDWESLKRVVNYFNASELSQAILGLKPEDHLSMPGKLMGFAAHGVVVPEITSFIQNNASVFRNQLNVSTHPFIKDSIHSIINAPDPTRVNGCADMAACMQKDFADSVIEFLGRWKKKSDCRNLYYSGGAALNIHTNVRIENELGFHHVFIPPAPNDCGLALGAAAIAEWRERKLLKLATPFIIRSTLDNEDRYFCACGDILKEIAGRIAVGQVVGTVMGHGECGPRALGHRSILARPDIIEIRKRISETMKKREWYRPVSPIMLEDTAMDCLEAYRTQSHLPEYMSGAWRVKSQWIDAFQGVVHVDGSVRAQVVRENSFELSSIHRLLVVLKVKYGIYGLLNTSFNQRGEPIVQSLDEAMDSGRAMQLDALWIENNGQSEIRDLKRRSAATADRNRPEF